MDIKATEQNVRSVVVDTDETVYCFDEDDNDLYGWPASWPNKISDIVLFCREKQISVRY